MTISRKRRHLISADKMDQTVRQEAVIDQRAQSMSDEEILRRIREMGEDERAVILAAILKWSEEGKS